jgi:hypothetical protein
LGELTRAALKGEVGNASPIMAQIDSRELCDKVKRIRSGVKAIYDN